MQSTQPISASSAFVPAKDNEAKKKDSGRLNACLESFAFALAAASARLALSPEQPHQQDSRKRERDPRDFGFRKLLLHDESRIEQND